MSPVDCIRAGCWCLTENAFASWRPRDIPSRPLRAGCTHCHAQLSSGRSIFERGSLRLFVCALAILPVSMAARIVALHGYVHEYSRQ